MVSGNITEDDYRRVLLLDRVRPAMHARIWLSIVTLGGIWMLLSNVLHGGYVLLALGVGGLLAELYTVRVRVPRTARKRLSQYRELSQPVTYSWDGEMIKAEMQSGHSARPWRLYVRRKEDDAVILLYLTDGLFQIFPKRWFSDANSLEQFRQLSLVVRS